MAFAEPYDPLNPPEPEAIALGAGRIRELKRAITERLLQFFPGWPNTDPLVIDQTKLFTSVTVNAIITGTPTTLFTVPVNIEAIYIVNASTLGQAAAQSAACYVATSSDGSTIVFGHVTPAGSLVTLTVAAGAIQVTHTAGANRNIKASLRRMN